MTNESDLDKPIKCNINIRENAREDFFFVFCYKTKKMRLSVKHNISPKRMSVLQNNECISFN